MKKLLILLLISSIAILSAIPLHIVYDLDTIFTQNVWHLSEYDLERVDEGSEYVAFAESADDLILKSKVKFSTDYAFSKRFKIVPSAKLAYNYYLSNGEKSSSSILCGVDIDYKPFALELRYGFYPGSYLRDYKDNKSILYDGTGDYEKFEYDKNLYKAGLNWQAFKKHRFSGSIKMEDYYHNEYFTEYDGRAFTYELGWRGSFPGVYLDFSYAFKKFETEDDIASLYAPDADYDEIPSDWSYESNIYNARVRLKKIDTSNKNFKYRLVLDLDLENRFYQGSDSIHAGREDLTMELSPAIVFYFNKNFDITLDYSYLNRTVESPDSSVPKYKNYTDNAVSLGLSYKFDLFD